ncbi:hypothetical protein [Aeromonas salmonicida]|uniref:hypothetical protein n=1 Tax=Aeromonas salmonicida TaxID=645 RepID=UPI00232B5170|nr:hypothetical protein [Aeromonas salmonicida]WCH23629.1 hypothetical protein ONZ54_04475 [Aeromonas salmonicida]
MSAIIGLDGTRFNRKITESDMEKISSATNINDVSSIFGNIVDWFCGTRKEAAKAELFHLIHSELGYQKIEHFTKLKNMASPVYKDNFTYQASNCENGSFNVDLTIMGVLEIRQVNTPGKIEEISEKVKSSLDLKIIEGSESLEQIKKDIGRFTYHCEGVTYQDGSLPEETLKAFTSKMSPNQKKSLDVIASQTGIIAIKNGIHRIGDGRSFVGTPELQEISMSKDGAGVVQVELKMKQNHQEDRFEIYKKSVPGAQYPCLSMSAIIKINPDGSHCFESVKVSHPGF